MRGDCKHCNKLDIYLQGRGLCQTCHKNPEIKSQYPCLTGRSNEETARDHEPESEEELEALIAHQLANLPDWWDEVEKRQLREHHQASEPRIYTLVRARERLRH
jgi:hypothetical protein